LNRWGIEAIVSESFAEIFQGNCTAIGVPCVTASSEDVSMLMAKVDSDPSLVIDIDLTGCKITGSGIDIAVSMPEGMRKQFLDGLWDSTGMLVDGMD
ncbi:MAG: isopropylmalate isomerase, partial [Candidatus Latescibacteria bacterium]|nr:isopropylmalate isomerase [Candidatus Latescibacterota bacterium]